MPPIWSKRPRNALQARRVLAKALVKTELPGSRATRARAISSSCPPSLSPFRSAPTTVVLRRSRVDLVLHSLSLCPLGHTPYYILPQPPPARTAPMESAYIQKRLVLWASAMATSIGGGYRRAGNTGAFSRRTQHSYPETIRHLLSDS